MTEAVQLHIFQLVYTFIRKRLVLMGKTIHFFFNHLSIYHHVCCLLSNLKCLLGDSQLCRLQVWLWWMPRGGDGVVGSEHVEVLGALPGARSSLSDVLHPFALSFQTGCVLVWVWFFGLGLVCFWFGFFYIQFFPLTLYFSFIKFHMYFEFFVVSFI